AIGLFRKAAAADPKLVPFLAYTIGNLTRHRCALGMYDLALESAREDVAIRRTLVAGPPQGNIIDHRKALAGGLARLPVYQRAVGTNEPAFEASSQAVELFEEMELKTDESLDEKVVALVSLAMSLARLGRSAEAYRRGLEAVALCRSLAATGPEISLPNLAS